MYNEEENLVNIFENQQFNKMIEEYNIDNEVDENKIHLYLKNTFKLLQEEKPNIQIENFKLEDDNIIVDKEIYDINSNIVEISNNCNIELKDFLDNIENFSSIEIIKVLLYSHNEKANWLLIFQKIVNYHLKYNKIKEMFIIFDNLDEKYCLPIWNSLISLNGFKINELVFNEEFENFIYKIKVFNKEIINIIYEICKNNNLNNDILASISYLINFDINLKHDCIIKAIKLCNSKNLRLVNKFYMNIDLFDKIIWPESMAIFEYLVLNKLDIKTYKKGFSTISICIYKNPDIWKITFNWVNQMNEEFLELYLSKLVIFFQLSITSISIANEYLNILYLKYENYSEVFLKLVNILVTFVNKKFDDKIEFKNFQYEKLKNYYRLGKFLPIYEIIQNSSNTYEKIKYLKNIISINNNLFLFFTNMKNYDCYDLEDFIWSMIYNENPDFNFTQLLINSIVRIKRLDINKLSIWISKYLQENKQYFNYLVMYFILKISEEFTDINIFELFKNLVLKIIEYDFIENKDVWKYLTSFLITLNDNNQNIIIQKLPDEYRKKFLRVKLR